MQVDLDLLRSYNRSLPRYTSYPTAPHFDGGVDREQFLDEVRRRDAAEDAAPLSLYVHLPFCRQLCYYCGCHAFVTHSEYRIQRYLDHVEREIDLLADELTAERPVIQIHWGGGTPTYLTPAQIRELGAKIRDRFAVADDAEISLEADPRGLTREHVAAASDVGFNRMSVGAQTFDATVQEAIHRVQPEQLTRDAVRWARDEGFEGVNLDLIYGLPHQSLDGFEETLASVQDIDPDRIALYSYAHVPSVLEHQKLIPEDALPDPAERLTLFKTGIETLTQEAGYRFIGMDHFARPDDPLSIAQDEHTLQRNFQGYSTRAGADVYAVGVSGIHQLAPLYAQNVKDLRTYYERIEAGRLSVERGVRLTPDDHLRRRVIMDLMCNFSLAKSRIEAAFDIDFDRYFAPDLARLEPLEADGLVDARGATLDVRPPGRLLIRNVASKFDAYLHETTEARPVYSESL